MKKNIIYDDLYRYSEKRDLISLIKEIISNSGFQYVFIFRKIQMSENFILKYFYKILLKMLGVVWHFQIPYQVEIGEGFYIGHFGSIVINPNAKLGKNINIHQGVTIGQTNRGERKGVPVIGDEVWIGANATIVGKIKIGRNVLIAPNSYVNFDVPDNSIVIGNPGKIIHKENATECYINNKI